MNIIRTVDQLREKLLIHRSKKNSIGLVPTMGSLHEGHSSLVQRSVAENDLTVVTIFVNPLQFNSAEDLEKYPRDENRDFELLRRLSVNIVFAPEKEEVYKHVPQTAVTVSGLENKLEGLHRPGHFQGVGLVVSKLINYTLPDRAYFGLKDLQQFMIIRKIVEDLSFPVEVVGVKTVRSASGLALSSRNARLSKKGMEIAANIFRGLTEGLDHLQINRQPELTKTHVASLFNEVSGLEVEYLSIIDPHTFCEIETFLPGNPVAICVAAYVEGIRLIDNLYLRPDSPA